MRILVSNERTALDACFKCGSRDHWKRDCPWNRRRCMFCSQDGHTTRACPLFTSSQKDDVLGRHAAVAPKLLGNATQDYPHQTQEDVTAMSDEAQASSEAGSFEDTTLAAARAKHTSHIVALSKALAAIENGTLGSFLWSADALTLHILVMAEHGGDRPRGCVFILIWLCPSEEQGAQC
eukprot:NODE_4986_length_1823_cov_8.221108.p1 GENE.NODE_4986_length_1823_cov_8.221108~~NODE_4986_length_1823_cov_8.221108.p1  ORF type:complete len:179 (-),score=23.80 NODE_4986_length_1823_cov_8.221108:866-1402(-)